MATTTIFGNFNVIDGVSVNGATNGRITYALYKTSIYTSDLQAALPAIIRCFLPTGAIPFDNDTTVFLYGKITTPIGQPCLIEAVNMFPYPGNPGDANYGDVPAFAPRICVLGHVAGEVEKGYAGRRTFRVLSAAYVRDQLQETSFMVFFENTARWKKTNPPNEGSAIFIIGPLVGRHEGTGIVLLSIEDITFYAGSRPDNSAAGTQGTSTTQRTRLSARNGWVNNNGSINGNIGNQSDPILINSSDSSDDHSRNSPQNSSPIPANARTRVPTALSSSAAASATRIHNDAEPQMTSVTTGNRSLPLPLPPQTPQPINSHMSGSFPVVQNSNQRFANTPFISYGGHNQQAPNHAMAGPSNNRGFASGTGINEGQRVLYPTQHPINPALGSPIHLTGTTPESRNERVEEARQINRDMEHVERHYSALPEFQQSPANTQSNPTIEYTDDSAEQNTIDDQIRTPVALGKRRAKGSIQTPSAVDTRKSKRLRTTASSNEGEDSVSAIETQSTLPITPQSPH
ncbi:hypothetical protein M422DRAFT_275675 [Sphaerobolus stellatus SS14]|uniref:Uncharacterized protein n=1 Tax=Sphaerobolus stellatus (strain SS14) TaxID=990650 RepID=A0A0C9UDY8_SPHS4|nr:hypothetical protein M422DRAFT_275675 [Sphaerobolus stellatus SS14]